MLVLKIITTLLIGFMTFIWLLIQGCTKEPSVKGTIRLMSVMLIFVYVLSLVCMWA